MKNFEYDYDEDGFPIDNEEIEPNRTLCIRKYSNKIGEIWIK